MIQPHGAAAILGSAADYAGIPQNALLAVITGVVFRFLSRQQPSDQVLRIAGAMAFAEAAVAGALTVTGFAAVVWTGLIAGCLAWLSIPLWVLATGRVLVPSLAPQHAKPYSPSQLA